MFKKITKLENCVNYLPYGNSLFIHNESNLLKELDVNTFEVKNEIYLKNSELLKQYNGRFYFSSDVDIQLLDREKFEFNRIWEPRIYSPFYDAPCNFIIESYSNYDEETANKSVVVFDSDSREMLWKKAYGYKVFNSLNRQYGVLRNYKFYNVGIVDMQDGNILWEWESELELERHIYTCGDTLVLILKVVPLEEYHVLGIDIKTGEHKWRIEGRNQDFLHDPDKGYLYAFGKTMKTINLNQGKVIHEIDLTKIYDTFDGGFEDMCLSKHGIYLLNNWGSPSQFGLLDLETYTVDQVYDIGAGKGVKCPGMYMQSYENRVYMRDSNYVLHIWEKE